MEEMKTVGIFERVKESFLRNPRDVLTFGGRKYFYVYVERGELYVEGGREHKNASRIKGRRKLDKANAEAVYAKYKVGAELSKIRELTYNSVYWLGIFRALDL